MGFLDKSEDEVLHEKAWSIREMIFEYSRQSVKYPTEANIAAFVKRQRLPQKIYSSIGRDKELLWKVTDLLPGIVSTSFSHNFKRYYENKKGLKR
jgi:hypothetical protein